MCEKWIDFQDIFIDPKTKKTFLISDKDSENSTNITKKESLEKVEKILENNNSKNNSH